MNHQRSEQSLSFQERGSRGEVLAGKYTVVRVYAKSFPDNADLHPYVSVLICGFTMIFPTSDFSFKVFYG